MPGGRAADGDCLTFGPADALASRVAWVAEVFIGGDE